VFWEDDPRGGIEAGRGNLVGRQLAAVGLEREHVEDVRQVLEHDRYRCPAGESLTRHFKGVRDGLTMYTYFSSDPTCRDCAMRAQCTTSPMARRVARWEHENVIDAVQCRLDEALEMMQRRRETVEHPFGTLKAWMGAPHFLTKTLPRVRAEMSLQALAYNMKRVIRLLGVSPLIEAVRAV
jgi:hypothetical protein